MRTTVDLDDDITAAVARLRRERGLGLSAAVNELARAGLVNAGVPRRRVRLETRRMDLRIDVSNVAEALEAAERQP